LARVAPQLEVDAHPLVLVQHSVCINRPMAAVTAALAANPGTWLPSFDGPIHAEVGRSVAGLRHQKNAVVEVDQPLTAGDCTVVSITWEATFIKRLFPVMTGTVELAPEDAHFTRLTVCGMYEPLLGSLGKQLDDSLLQQAAKAAVTELAESMAKRLVALTVDAAHGIRPI
jgi:hypothetical protein